MQLYVYTYVCVCDVSVAICVVRGVFASVSRPQKGEWYRGSVVCELFLASPL